MEMCAGLIISLILLFFFIAGNMGLRERTQWQLAREANGQPSARIDSQSGDCLGRILGILGRVASLGFESETSLFHSALERIRS